MIEVRSIDARADAATDELRAAVAGRSPAVSDIARASRSRRSARVAVTAAATVAVVLGGLAFGTRAVRGVDPTPVETPVVTPTPSPTPVRGLACQLPGVRCRGSEMRVAGILAVPVTVVPAPGVDTDDVSPGRSNIEFRRKQGATTSGLTVFEAPQPVDGGRDQVVAAWGRSAYEAALWLSGRSFIESTRPTRTAVGGLDAWRVVARLRPGAPLPSFALGYPAALTFLNGDGFGTGGSTVVAERLPVSYYYLVDVPAHGVVVLWVWSWQGDQPDVDAMDVMVHSLRFG